MDEIDILIDEIVQTLKLELPTHYQDYLVEFELLVDRDLLRASFEVLDGLRRKPDWQPSAKLNGLIDMYKVVF